MSPEILSHYTYSQFFLVLTLLISFTGSSIHGFLSVYYCKAKGKALFLWIPYLLLLMASLQIETSYLKYQGFVYILLFRSLAAFIFVVFLYLFVRKRTTLPLIGIMGASAIFYLSFHAHYLPLYLTASFLFLIIRITKPEPMEVIIKKYAGSILYELKEAVLIISLKKEILHINPYMRDLLGIDMEEKTIFKEKEAPFCINQLDINRLIKNKKSGHLVKQIKNNFFLINYTFIPGKGIIFTASDITKSIELQKKIQKNIEELEILNTKIQQYSEKTESLRISKERRELIRYIQSLIKSGMAELQTSLEQIKDQPPESFDDILNDCRSLLQEIRLIVKGWRTIEGDSI